jgi:hypothetical protein
MSVISLGLCLPHYGKKSANALLNQASTDSQMIELLRDRSDNDEQLRTWAKETLKGIGD